MSDEEDNVSGSEDEEDFSASEDEWLPTKDGKKKTGKNTKRSDGEDSLSEDDSDLEDFEERSSKKKGKPSSTSSRKRPASKSPSKQAKPSGTSSKRKRLSPGLRDRLYQQYKKDLLKEIAPARASLNSSVSEILQKCRYQRKPSASGKSTADDSDSGDDHLVDPEKLDLGATFFDKNVPTAAASEPSGSGEAPPHFDVNAGMRLSDSSDGEQDPTIGEKHLPASIPKQAADKLISHINQQSSEYMNFTNLDQFTAKVEEAKKLLRSYQQQREVADSAKASEEGATSSSATNEQQESVSNLLALGETDIGGSVGKKDSNVDADASSDSEWEEVQTGAAVEEKPPEPKSATETGGWQVTIEMETAQSRRKRREEMEMELYIKREINRVKRKIQLNYHKSSVLCAIAIGQRLGRIVCGDQIRGMLMSVMQDKCGDTKAEWDDKKVKRLAAWFKEEFELQSNDFLAPRTGCSVSFVLALAVYTRKVACRRDYTLLFLVCLRLAGAQARLVLSANVPPKRPPLSELCPMSERQTKEKLGKRSSSGATGTKKEQDGKFVPDDTVQKQSAKLKNEQEPREKLAPEVPETVDKKEKSTLSAATKENPAPARRSPRGSNAGTTQKPIAQARTTRRKALSTLNIPQLDGGDDLLPVITRTLRSRSVASVALADSPGSSPFAKRKSNKATAAGTSSASQRTVTRKRKLFSAEPEVKPVSSTTKRPVTKTTSKGKNASAQQEAPKTKPRMNRPDPPSDDDDDAFELKVKGSKKKAPERATRNQQKLEKTPLIVLKDMSGESIEPEGESSGKHSGSKQAPPARVQRERRVSAKKKLTVAASDDSGDDSDFELPKKSPKERNRRVSSASKVKKSPRGMATGDSQQDSQQRKATDLWIEFYNEQLKRWITFDLASEQADCVDLIVRNAPSPISYVFGWDNEAHLKDITARYVKNWNTACRMLRVESAWLDKVLAPFAYEKTDRDKLEEQELNKLDADKPLPTTITELKNHPLYALRRHLLKFEALYPAEPPTLGFIRGEAIYSRDCVHTLQTREKWYKQGRVVRAFETAYKVVRGWKYDRATNNWLNDQPCEIFGHWQTDEFDPPTAENGLVPRNEYGNVELFTEKMLPKGTVHLKLPGLNKVCKRLQIDCAPALTGFDMAKMRMVPVYDGFVVCQEFADQAIEEWYKEMEKEEQREQEKQEKRVYGNWKRLIKGLLVRRKLQNKYNFDNLAL
uniref:Rad4 beta-hairpin domain-containing protein n=1 Tax=Anopheles dirus TaxID=7168 RepID=A0A182NFU8_9DIPT